MLNLQKLQNLNTYQNDPNLGSNAATAAALASLQGLAAGLTASAAAAAAVLNSPLNLTVSNNNAIAGDLLNAKDMNMVVVNEKDGLEECTTSCVSDRQKDSIAAVLPGDQTCGSSVANNTSSQNALANVLSSAAAAAAVAASATASPSPQLQTQSANGQMPQMILASGKLVQGVQGAQLLIPTAQGRFQLWQIAFALCKIFC